MIDITNLYRSPSDCCRHIAEHIKILRKRKGYTQETLSKRSGVSYGSIKRFETSGEISLKSLAKLAWALDVDDELDSLFAAPVPNSIEHSGSMSSIF